MSVPIVWVAAVLAGLAVFTIATRRPSGLSERLEPYLSESEAPSVVDVSLRSRLLPIAPWVAVGVFVGVLLAQGDLFIAGPGLHHMTPILHPRNRIWMHQIGHTSHNRRHRKHTANL